jgi:hypothetical protein
MLTNMGRLLFILSILLTLRPLTARADATHSGQFNITSVGTLFIYANQSSEVVTVFVTVCLASGPASVQVAVASGSPFAVGTAGCRGATAEIGPNSGIGIINQTATAAVGTYQISIVTKQ